MAEEFQRPGTREAAVFLGAAGQRVSGHQDGLEDSGSAVGAGSPRGSVVPSSREGPRRTSQRPVRNTQQRAVEEDLRAALHRRPQEGQPGDFHHSIHPSIHPSKPN